MTQNEINTRVKTFIDNTIATSRDRTIVDVLPMRCGIGKSTYIRGLIREMIDKGTGLIIITDSIDRMEEYTNTEDTKLQDYIERNQDRISVLKSSNVAHEFRTIHSKPIVLMTTQRYFNMNREEIQSFTGANGGMKRETIIFDERPYFMEHCDISQTVLSDVENALYCALDDTVDDEKKYWMIEQWQNVKKDIAERFKEFETGNDAYHKDEWQNPGVPMTEDDERFLSLVSEFAKSLNKYDVKTTKNIFATYQIYKDGALIVSDKRINKSTKEYEYNNMFRVVIDNRDKLVDVGAKIFVLDGTSDVSPEYDVDYVKLRPCDTFKLPLDKLTIDIVNAKTGKRYLLDKSNNAIDAISDYTRSLDDCSAVFSHRQLANKFQSCDFDYFGNIKGKNIYRNKTGIAQVGLNRFKDIDYDQLALFLYRQKNPGKNPADLRCDDEFAEIVRNVMCRSILADLEQNIFRAKIRNVDCIDNVTYTVIFDTVAYFDLIAMIEERFGSLGATINIKETPWSIKEAKAINRETEVETNSAKIHKWLNEHAGELVSTKYLLDSLGLTANQLKSVKNKENGVRERLDEYRVNKGIYCIGKQ